MVGLQAICLAALGIGWAFVAYADDVADEVAATRVETGAPALAAIVMVDGEVRGSAADGLRSADGSTPVTGQERWHLGSISKAMTATLVARLVEKDIVSWDDTVGEVLGDAVPAMHDAYRPATYRHLLAHRSGLPGNIPPEDFARFEQRPADAIADRLAWARVALAQEPVGPLGTSFQYANSGYVVAAAMLEAVTGAPWEELIWAEVFSPLGLHSAGFGPPGTTGADDEPRGHQRMAGVFQAVELDADNPGAVSPAGRVHMTLEDLARFADVHRRRDPAYLAAKSFETLHSPPFGGVYALGWVQDSDGTLWHTGTNGLWYAEVAFSPQTGVVVAVAANAGDLTAVGAPASRLLRRLTRTARDIGG
jgi:CubicO group peptidase (beta-lactamase class C family)